MIAVNRAHNGVQNPLNGKQMPTGVGFRASNGESVPTGPVSKSISASESTSLSASTSASESTSVSTSASASDSASMSASDSTSTSANRLNSESTSELTGNSSNQLPNTGTEASKSSIVLGALAGVTGLGLLAKRRHDENEDEA